MAWSLCMENVLFLLLRMLTKNYFVTIFLWPENKACFLTLEFPTVLGAIIFCPLYALHAF